MPKSSAAGSSSGVLPSLLPLLLLLATALPGSVSSFAVISRGDCAAASSADAATRRLQRPSYYRMVGSPRGRKSVIGCWSSPPTTRDGSSGPSPLSSVAPRSSRRDLLRRTAAALAGGLAHLSLHPAVASAASADSVDDAEITDKIFFTIRGLPSSSSDSGGGSGSTKRVVIGLFGKDAPSSVEKIKKLFSAPSDAGGLPAPCRPREERALEQDQLRANKVYNSCKQREETGVTLRDSTIWRIIPNYRIDVGAVVGKFAARQFPNWDEANGLQHDRAGVVSVRRGDDGGFGFTIFPGGDGGDSRGQQALDEQNVVVGRVLEGMDVIEELNTKVPVITTSKVSYMGLTGGGSGAGSSKAAPSRACTFGGPMYCNENKPLIKLSLDDTGALSR